MKVKMVMFDLDGTLLPMDMDEFTGGYFKLLAKKAAPHGYEPQPLVKAIWHGTAAMGETTEKAKARTSSGKTLRPFTEIGHGRTGPCLKSSMAISSTRQMEQSCIAGSDSF